MSLDHLTLFNGQPAVTLRAPDGARATVLLQGAHLVSWIPAGGEEQLYLSPTSRYGNGASVRGGVPVIFPQFSQRGPLPRHGFVRTRPWQLDETLTRGPYTQAVLRIASNAETRALWPHEFEAELTVSLGGTQIDIEFAVANTGHTPFEFTAALHTYLRTNDVLKAQLEGLQGLRYEDCVAGRWEQQWGDVATVVTEIDRVYQDVAQPLTLRELGRCLTLSARGFTDAVVWNPGAQKCAQLPDMPADDWRHMLCIEAACAVEPVPLPPGAEWAGTQTLSV